MQKAATSPTAGAGRAGRHECSSQLACSSEGRGSLVACKQHICGLQAALRPPHPASAAAAAAVLSNVRCSLISQNHHFLGASSSTNLTGEIVMPPTVKPGMFSF